MPELTAKLAKYTGTATKESYQWYRDGTAIKGATSPSYTTVLADEGTTLTFKQTLSNDAETTETISAGYVVGVLEAPALISIPTFSGTLETGFTLVATPAVFEGLGITVTSQWLRDGSPISGANSTTYTIVTADLGTSISYRETATNSAGSVDAVSASQEIDSGQGVRNFTELSSAGSQYYTIPAVTLANDWEIEADFQTSSGEFETIIGYGTDTSKITIVQVPWDAPSGESNIAIYLSGSNHIFQTNTFVTVGTLHTLKVTLVGTTVTVYIDNTLVSSTTMTPYTSSVDFEIGNTSSFVGWAANNYLANVKITDNGTLVRSYAIDEDWSGGSTVLVDSVSGQNGTAVNITDADASLFTLEDTTWLGPDILANGTFDDDSEWSLDPNWSIAGGAAHSAGTGYLTDWVTYKEYIRVTYDVLNYVSGTVRVRFQSGTSGADRTANGTYIDDFSGEYQFRFQGLAFNGSVDNVIVQERIEVAT